MSGAGLSRILPEVVLMRVCGRIVGLVVLFLILAGCRGRAAKRTLLPPVPDGPRGVGTDEGDKVPEIVGEDLDGKKIKLSDYRGKVVLLDFWTHDCGICRYLNRHERSFVERMKDKPFAILGINLDPDKAAAKEAVADDGVTWPSIWDPHNTIAQDYVDQGEVPTLYLLDGNGVIRLRLSGMPRDPGQLDDYIEQLLQEKKRLSGEKGS
ncbi:MAG TPA: TlpA disulfide reductase family protein [Gemmataceae bacterium]|jgi:peroxiredoxin|nr:TlpA disulfide reductase family protein [Gemmataceae bacterium]